MKFFVNLGFVIEQILFDQGTKFLVMKNCDRKVVFVLTDSILQNLDLQKSPPLKV